MGLFCKTLKLNKDVETFLASDEYLCHKLDEVEIVDELTIGQKIRDGLVKPITSPVMSGLGFDGDVEGVDINPKQEENE